jgi:hypothetical protein
MPPLWQYFSHLPKELVQAVKRADALVLLMDTKGAVGHPARSRRDPAVYATVEPIAAPKVRESLSLAIICLQMGYF